jgi:hypothetical protein
VIKLVSFATASLFAANFAFAQAPAGAATGCEAKAVSKDGKPLAGAAKNAFMKKCMGGSENEGKTKGESKDKPSVASGCEAKAVSKEGKPLAGAAKAASIKKCEKDAAAAK